MFGDRTIRVSVTGVAESPPIDVTLALIGRERTLASLQTAIEFIEAIRRIGIAKDGTIRRF